jgi:hypothetical protein
VEERTVSLAGAGVLAGLSIRQTLSRLMQEFPHGFPLLQFRWASAVAGHMVAIMIAATDTKTVSCIRQAPAGCWRKGAGLDVSSLGGKFFRSYPTGPESASAYSLNQRCRMAHRKSRSTLPLLDHWILTWAYQQPR